LAASACSLNSVLSEHRAGHRDIHKVLNERFLTSALAGESRRAGGCGTRLRRPVHPHRLPTADAAPAALRQSFGETSRAKRKTDWRTCAADERLSSAGGDSKSLPAGNLGTAAVVSTGVGRLQSARAGLCARPDVHHSHRHTARQRSGGPQTHIPDWIESVENHDRFACR
jgi:hypothetical protein